MEFHTWQVRPPVVCGVRTSECKPYYSFTVGDTLVALCVGGGLWRPLHKIPPTLYEYRNRRAYFVSDLKVYCKEGKLNTPPSLTTRGGRQAVHEPHLYRNSSDAYGRRLFKVLSGRSYKMKFDETCPHSWCTPKDTAKVQTGMCT